MNRKYLKRYIKDYWLYIVIGQIMGMVGFFLIAEPGYEWATIKVVLGLEAVCLSVFCIAIALASFNPNDL